MTNLPLSDDQNSTERNQTVADYWDAHTDASYLGNSYWLANPIVAKRFNSMAVGHRDFSSWVDFCVEYHLAARQPVNAILTIGCGDGTLDRHLAGLKAAAHIDGIDIAPGRIDIARRLAEEAGLHDVIKYTVADVETNDFPRREYDAIFFNSSLHHIENLDAVLSRCAEALSENGLLFINEYVGPNRFDFSAEEQLAMSTLFKLLPNRFRRSNFVDDRGQVRTQVVLPHPDEVARVDPSEAIRSQDIIPKVTDHFAVLEHNVMCGSLMQFMLDGIAGNFREEDSHGKELLEILLDIEKLLIDLDLIGQHFVLLVCQKRKPDSAQA